MSYGEVKKMVHEPVGELVIGALWNCDLNILENPDKLKEILLEAAKEAKTTVVKELIYQCDDGGLTIVLILLESHLIIHTWPS